MSEAESMVITVERREELGRSAARRLRRDGRIPAVVYGAGKETFSCSVDEKAIQQLLKGDAGENAIFLLKLQGTKQERRAMIKDIQLDPITRRFEHIDFIRVTRGHKLTVSMPVELSGDCPGVREGGRVNLVSWELELEILPREMFDKIEVDISKLDIGDQLTVADLEDLLPSSARFLEDAGRTVVVIEAPRAEVEEEEAAEAELVIEEQAEPEVLRGRKEGEEAEEA